MPSARVLKLADQIKMIVAQMLERRVKDPRLGFVTITDVRLTGDTREATVFYTVFGDDADASGTAAALRSATGLIRAQVGKQLGLRFTPTLTFVADAVPETARQIDDLLAAARASDDEVARRRAGASYAGEPDPYRKTDESDDESAEPDEDDAAADDDAADDAADDEADQADRPGADGRQDD
jgi:ribosome-binding factor A